MTSARAQCCIHNYSIKYIWFRIKTAIILRVSALKVDMIGSPIPVLERLVLRQPIAYLDDKHQHTYLLATLRLDLIFPYPEVMPLPPCHVRSRFIP